MRWWQARSLSSESPGNYKSYKPRFKTRQRVADANRTLQRVPDWEARLEKSTAGPAAGWLTNVDFIGCRPLSSDYVLPRCPWQRPTRITTACSVLAILLAEMLTRPGKSEVEGRDVTSCMNACTLHSNMKFINTLYQEITPSIAITTVSIHYSKVHFNRI